MESVQGLKVFLAVADALSFTRAAERLFLTQSAVSHQIARLEADLGCQVLERQGRTVGLTAAGRTLVDHARKVFSTLEEATSATRAAAHPNRGRLRIGASNTTCQYILPEALREFRECFPEYSLSIIPGDSPIAVEHLAAGRVDLALMIRTERDRRVAYHPLFDDDLQMMVSALHPWAKAGKVDRRQVGAQQMVLYNRNSATSKLVERYFVKQQLPLRDWIELGDIGAIKELVKLGLGVSVSADWVARPEIEEGSLVLLPLPGSKLRRNWCAATPANKQLSLAEQTFIGLCQSVAAKLGRKTSRA
jgi:DNA-binding transcriptional LysR family regulator